MDEPKLPVVFFVVVVVLKIKKQKQILKKIDCFFYQHKAWSQSEFVSNCQLFVDDDISPAKEDQTEVESCNVMK